MRNSMRRSARKPALRFDHGILHLDGALHGIDNAAELDQRAIARALHHAPLCTATVGSIRSARRARSRASLRSSSAPVSRLNPTTSAARIAASFLTLAIWLSPLAQLIM
jgi:hypothetical protein